MGFLLDKCTFQVLNETTLKECIPFTCGNNDLDEFFSKECCLYSKQLLGKSYCFRLDSDPSIIVCAFTLSNDSIKVNMLPNARKGVVSKKHGSIYGGMIPYGKEEVAYNPKESMESNLKRIFGQVQEMCKDGFLMTSLAVETNKMLQELIAKK